MSEVLIKVSKVQQMSLKDCVFIQETVTQHVRSE